jgi:fructose-1,6-bisphosphatase/inositol monophosphatase family enzyme
MRGIIKTKFLPDDLKVSVARRAGAMKEVQPGSGCAGADYPALIAGTSDFALYWRTLPWDHAPGVLLLGEAGGHAARLDGSAYRAGDSQPGLLAAGSRDLWEQAHALILAPPP